LSIAFCEVFVGFAYVNVARLFEIMQSGLSVKVITDAHFRRRPDNESFGAYSRTRPLQVTTDGFTKIVNRFFGPQCFNG
jgi:hypothetical protein